MSFALIPNLSNFAPRLTRDVVSSDGTRLAVQEWGQADGPVVVLLHAFGMTNVGWARQVTGPLAATHRLVTFDHRGHGASDHPTDPAAYANGGLWADDIAAVIDSTGAHKVSIIAWSMSGALFGDYLATYGDAKINRVVLIGAANALGQTMFATGQPGLKFADERANLIHVPDFFTQFAGFAHVNDGLTDDPMDDDTWALVQAGSLLLPVLARGAILMRDQDSLPAYGASTVPVLQIHSTNDPIIAITAAERLKAARPDVARLQFDTGAHAPHWAHADAVNAALVDFLGGGMVP